MKIDATRWAMNIGAVVFIIGAAATWLSVVFPSAGFASGIATILPLAEPRAAKADQALKSRDFAAALRNTHAELALSPARSAPWLRLAQIDLAQHYRLTSLGVTALEHDYDAVPYDLDPDTARMPFVLAHLGDGTPSLELSVSDELGVWASSRPLRRRLSAFEERADPVGRVAVTTALAGADVR